MRALVKQTQAFAEHHRLWKDGASLVVAVSGGADSSALLDILVRLQPKYHLHLRVAHVNYRLRGEDSDRDEACARAAAKRNHLPFHVFRPKPKAMQNLENRLREERYGFFSRLCVRFDCDAVVTGHTLDDQAETVLLHLVQGAGTRGLRGMLPKTGNIIRPLLFARHSQLVQYCQQFNVAFGEDVTNADTSFMRNRIRHELLPFLRERFTPSIEMVLARNASVLAQEYAQNEYLRKCFFEANTSGLQQGIVTKTLWRHAQPEERLLWLENQCQELRKTLSWRQMQEVVKYLEQPSWRGKEVCIGGLSISLKNDTLSLT